MTKRSAKTALYDEFAKIGKAVSSGRRVELLDLLANGERAVDSIAEQSGLTVANASQHLQALRQAGLVDSRREGTYVRYRLAGTEVLEFINALRALAREQIDAVERLAAAYLGNGGDLEPLTKEELRKRLSRGDELVVLDVRPTDEFEAGHLPNAVSIPIDQLGRRIDELPHDREIVAYCRGQYCAFAHQAVDVLRQHGFNARRMVDGLPEWAAAGLPVDTATVKS